MKISSSYFFLGVLVLGLALFVISTQLKKASTINEHHAVKATSGRLSPISEIILGPIQGWGDTLNYLSTKKILNPDELDKLDFSEGNPFSADNEKWQVFNPKGHFKLGTPDGDAFNHRWLDELSTVENNKVIFNLRQLQLPDGKLQFTLYLVIPDVSKQQCARHYNPFNDPEIQAVRQTEKTIEIAPDNHTTIVDNSSEFPGKGGCIQEDAVGKIYLFLPFYKYIQK